MLSQIASPSAELAAFFRFRRVGDRYVIINHEGRWLVLEPHEFRAFAEGGVPEDGALWQRLREHNFLRDHYDVPKAVEMLRARKHFVLERYAAIFLTKILRGEDPNFLDIRWPASAGIGQLAYNYDGKVFTCDEGRMLHEMGDDTFELGHVATSSYRDIVGHPTVRAVALASNLEQNPDCVNCAYLPYCGLPPVHSHKTQGTLFSRPRESTVCYVHKHIQDYLFDKLATADAETLAILERWTTHRPREHFLQ